MDLNEDKRQQISPKRCMIILGFVLAVCNSIGIGYLGDVLERDFVWKVKMVFAGILFLSLAITCLYHLWEKEEKNLCIPYCFAMGISYVLSLLSIIVGVVQIDFPFWMIGGFLLAVIWNPYVGSVCQVYFAFFHGVVQEQDMGTFAISFFLALGLCFFVPYLRNMASVGYVVMLALAGNGIGIILKEEFNLFKIVSANSFFHELAMFFTLLLCGGLSWLFRIYIRTGTLAHMPSAIKEALKEKDEEQLWEPGVFMRLGDMHTVGEKESITIQEVCKEDFVLQRKLRSKLPEVYLHTKNVAELGRQAAACIGADIELVYSGGLYHEIGKLEGQDYVKNGIRLAKEYDFPKALIQLIEEHNVTYKFATTREAAVLMLTDSVISMIERIGTNEPGQEKMRCNMVEKVFDLRLQKGELDESQLTIGDIKQLREFFCQSVYDGVL